MIHYRIEVASAATHQFKVTLTVAAPKLEQYFSLPVWIPGSYMVREFSRHLSGLHARQGAQPRRVCALAKDRWLVATQGRSSLVLSYLVYAFDMSVRTAWLGEDRGFFNPTSLCLAVEGRTDEPHRIELYRMPSGWDVATAMPRLRASADEAVVAQKSMTKVMLKASAKADASRLTRAVLPARTQVFESADYDELADHPFELGQFWRGEFSVCGVAHELVVSGAWPHFDGARFMADVERICAEQIRFWHGSGAAPFKRYVFLLYGSEDGYGGLEHRASTALIAARKDFPRIGISAMPDGYVTLLGLVSHEYFHTWNVKRLKPAEFLRYDYGLENYTELLWFFEGFTSYYDDLFLLRSGLIDAPRYLRLVARTLNGVRQTPGQQVQSVAEASFDAWIKYYRSDENTPNATISYYAKGALIALRLDIALRLGGKASLDDLMRALWQMAPQSVSSPDCDDRALTEALILETVARLGGKAMAADLHQWVHERGELDVLSAFARVGVESEVESVSFAAELGLRVSEGPLTGIHVKAVLSSGAAAAGVFAGDEILAINGWRLRRLEEAQGWIGIGEAFELLLVRQQRVLTVQVAARSADERIAASPIALKLAAAANTAVRNRRLAWLGQ